MMNKYILSIDQGTTSSRAILFDKKGNIVAISQKEIELIYLRQGWVEADPVEIWISVVDVVNEVLIKGNATWKNIDSIGITNQRETTIVWDKKTGKPIYNAIVWQSRQSSDICGDFSCKSDIIHSKTGLLINPYFSASKIRFILDNVKGAQEEAEKGNLLFGTIDTWLIYKMTNGKNHLTDTTNASRTMLFNIHSLEWDEELLKIFRIPKSMLPKVKSCNFDYGEASYFDKKVHIYAVAGDQHAALFGHNCFNAGECKNTYGTGCFMLMNTGNKPVISNNGLLTTIAWNLNGKITYALEGSVFIGGAAIQWLRDGLKAIKSAPESDGCASKVASSEGVYFVPAFVGLGAPYWDDDVRGSIFGITRSITRSHIVRATLESIAYQSKDVFEVMEKESGYKIPSLQVDGGATGSEILMQFQSDILQIDIKKPCCLELTALGVAYIAGLKSGYWKNIDEIKCCHKYKKIYSPEISVDESKKLYDGWKVAIKAAREFKLK